MDGQLRSGHIPGQALLTPQGRQELLDTVWHVCRDSQIQMVLLCNSRQPGRGCLSCWGAAVWTGRICEAHLTKSAHNRALQFGIVHSSVLSISLYLERLFDYWVLTICV